MSRAKTATSTPDQIFSTSIKMSKRIHKELKVQAAKEDRDMREVIEDALTAYFLKHGSE